MADKHPYAPSLNALVQVLDQFKKNFPGTVTADVLKKLSLAPNTESQIIHVIRFLGLIDDENARTETARRIFTLHDDVEFQNAFSELLKNAYSDLFSLHGDNAWTLDQSKLI